LQEQEAHKRKQHEELLASFAKKGDGDSQPKQWDNFSQTAGYPKQSQGASGAPDGHWSASPGAPGYPGGTRQAPAGQKGVPFSGTDWMEGAKGAASPAGLPQGTVTGSSLSAQSSTSHYALYPASGESMLEGRGSVSGTPSSLYSVSQPPSQTLSTQFGMRGPENVIGDQHATVNPYLDPRGAGSQPQHTVSTPTSNHMSNAQGRPWDSESSYGSFGYPGMPFATYTLHYCMY
jgi:hypothetical protein